MLKIQSELVTSACTMRTARAARKMRDARATRKMRDARAKFKMPDARSKCQVNAFFNIPLTTSTKLNTISPHEKFSFNDGQFFNDQ